MRIIICENCKKEIYTNNSQKKYCNECKEFCYSKKHNEYLKSDSYKEKRKIREKSALYKERKNKWLREVYTKTEKSKTYRRLYEKTTKRKEYNETECRKNKKLERSRKMRINLTDGYIRANLKHSSIYKIENISQELIEFTREHIRLKRLIKEIQAN